MDGASFSCAACKYNVECGRVPSGSFEIVRIQLGVPVSSSTNLPFLECNFREVGLGLIIVDDLGTRLEVDLEKGNVKGSE